MTPAPIKPVISLEVLNQIDIRVGTILSVADVPNSDKLLQLRVSFGDHERTIVAGMKTERAQSAGDRRQAGAVRGESGAAQDAGRSVGRDAVRHRLCRRRASGAGDAGKSGAGRDQGRLGLARVRSVPKLWRISRKRKLRGKGAAAILPVRRENPGGKNSCRRKSASGRTAILMTLNPVRPSATAISAPSEE